MIYMNESCDVTSHVKVSKINRGYFLNSPHTSHARSPLVQHHILIHLDLHGSAWSSSLHRLSMDRKENTVSNSSSTVGC
jgi:hypothetical protein